MERRPKAAQTFEIAGVIIPAYQVPRLLDSARELLAAEPPGLGREYMARLVKKLEEAESEIRSSLGA